MLRNPACLHFVSFGASLALCSKTSVDAWAAVLIGACNLDCRLYKA